MNMNMNMMGGTVGGPVGGGQQMMNAGTPGNAPAGNSIEGNRTKLHTYIYDYFLKNEMYDMARLLVKQVDIERADPIKQSPDRKDINRLHDAMDQDSKDGLHNKPDDLPLPKVPPTYDAFLFDWWCQFWDCYAAQRGRGSPHAKQYLNQVQVRSKKSPL